MNTFKVTVLLAMMVGVAFCGTCSDVCNAPCNVAKQSCDFLFNANSLCATNFNVCNMACANVCKCDDQCEAQCQPELDTCVGANAANPLGLAQCEISAGVCLTACQAQCSVDTAVSTVGSIAGFVGL